MSDQAVWRRVANYLAEPRPQQNTGLVNALLGYGSAFYDRSREPIGQNALGIRYGDLLPYYGAGLGFDDARRQAEQGNYGGAALTAGLTAMPWGTVLGRAGNALKREMTTYHGTPHTFQPEPDAPLGKFRSDKIGTGEGAQAFGYGHYLAENPKVAGEYQRVVSNDFLRVADGTMFSPDSLTHLNIRVATRKGGIDEGIKRAKTILSAEAVPTNARMLAQQDLRVLEEIKAKGGASPVPGNLYQVDLPDEHIAKMLDWDKPLSQQPESVRKALGHSGGGRKVDAPAIADDLELIVDNDYKLYQQSATVKRWIEKYKANPNDKTVRSALEGYFKEYGSQYPEHGSYLKGLEGEFALDTGEHLYRDLVKQLGSQEAASAKLRELGIPGIKYLDQGSRTAGKGTRNFVVFDDNLLKIVGKE